MSNKEVKTIRLTDKQDEFVQWYADALGIKWAEALRRILDTFIEQKESRK